MIIDLIVGLVVIASALISFMRGFIREVLTIAGVIGGAVAAVFIGPSLAPIVRDWFGAGEGDPPKKLWDIVPMEIVADITAYGVIFVAVVIVISVLSHFMSGAAKAVGLGPVDRTLGVIFGIARALVLLGLVYLPFHLLMDQKRKDEFFDGSQTHYFIEKISAAMASYLPDSDDVKDTTNDFKDKMMDQQLLGGDKKPEDAEPAPDADEGYKDEQREELDQLFEDPVTTPKQPAVNE